MMVFILWIRRALCMMKRPSRKQLICLQLKRFLMKVAVRGSAAKILVSSSKHTVYLRALNSLRCRITPASDISEEKKTVLNLRISLSSRRVV